MLYHHAQFHIASSSGSLDTLNINSMQPLCCWFTFYRKITLKKGAYFSKIYYHIYLHNPYQVKLVSPLPHKSAVLVGSNAIPFVPNFVKVGKSVHKLKDRTVTSEAIFFSFLRERNGLKWQTLRCCNSTTPTHSSKSVLFLSNRQTSLTHINLTLESYTLGLFCAKRCF
jgi:hypothetical protein